MGAQTEGAGVGLLTTRIAPSSAAGLPDDVALHQLPAERVDPKRNHIWVAVVLATELLAGGVLGSVLTAQSVARRNSERQRDALALSSVEVASTLRLAIQRDEDLAVSAAGFFLGTPFATNEQFLAWADTVQAMDRYPELLGWGDVLMITSAQQAIKALGVRIAVDDFGTGYSSLAYLQQFDVDCLKIDRAFTHAISSSPESKALIRTLVQLGRDLGLRTLAEGVETTGEMDHLRNEQVDEAQGFLLSRPLDAATLEEQILVPCRTKTEAPHTP